MTDPRRHTATAARHPSSRAGETITGNPSPHQVTYTPGHGTEPTYPRAFTSTTEAARSAPHPPEGEPQAVPPASMLAFIDVTDTHGDTRAPTGISATGQRRYPRTLVAGHTTRRDQCTAARGAQGPDTIGTRGCLSTAQNQATSQAPRQPKTSQTTGHPAPPI